jgi:hypothetical protein
MEEPWWFEEVGSERGSDDDADDGASPMVSETAEYQGRGTGQIGPERSLSPATTAYINHQQALWQYAAASGKMWDHQETLFAPTNVDGFDLAPPDLLHAEALSQTPFGRELKKCVGPAFPKNPQEFNQGFGVNAFAVKQTFQLPHATPAHFHQKLTRAPLLIPIERDLMFMQKQWSTRHRQCNPIENNAVRNALSMTQIELTAGEKPLVLLELPYFSKVFPGTGTTGGPELPQSAGAEAEVEAEVEAEEEEEQEEEGAGSEVAADAGAPVQSRPAASIGEVLSIFEQRQREKGDNGELLAALSGGFGVGYGETSANQSGPVPRVHRIEKGDWTFQTEKNKLSPLAMLERFNAPETILTKVDPETGEETSKRLGTKHLVWFLPKESEFLEQPNDAFALAPPDVYFKPGHAYIGCSPKWGCVDSSYPPRMAILFVTKVEQYCEGREKRRVVYGQFVLELGDKAFSAALPKHTYALSKECCLPPAKFAPIQPDGSGCEALTLHGVISHQQMEAQITFFSALRVAPPAPVFKAARCAEEHQRSFFSMVAGQADDAAAWDLYESAMGSRIDRDDYWVSRRKEAFREEEEARARERDRAAIGASEELEWTAMHLAQAISSGSSHRGDDVAGWRPQEGIGW